VIIEKFIEILKTGMNTRERWRIITKDIK